MRKFVNIDHIFVRIFVNLYAVGDDLYYKGRRGLRLVLKTRRDIEQALKECHDDPGSGGHRGMTITRLKVEDTYYWKSMTVDMRDWVSCQYVWVSCQYVWVSCHGNMCG